MTDGTAALRVEKVTKSFGGVQAIADVSFDVRDGSLTALIGPNGAGKSTMFNLLTNLYVADSGRISYFGRDLAGMRSDTIARLGLIRTFQTARIFPGMTALENALAGSHMHAKSGAWKQMLWLPGALREEHDLSAKADALLKLVGLSPFRNMAATDLPMGGQKLLEVVRALMAGPRLLLLDEPAAGLNDAETADLAELLRAVRDSGITVIVVEHNMSLVMGVADQVIVLDAGAVVASGTPREIQKDKRVIAAYVGSENA